MHFNVFDTDINDYVPSSLNPRSVKKSTRTQNTCSSVLSLSLRKKKLNNTYDKQKAKRLDFAEINTISDINDNVEGSVKSNMVRIKFSPKISHCAKCQMPNADGAHIGKCMGPVPSGKECEAGDKCCSCVENHFKIFQHNKLKDLRARNGENSANKLDMSLQNNNNKTDIGYYNPKRKTIDGEFAKMQNNDSDSSASQFTRNTKLVNGVSEIDQNEKNAAIQKWIEDTNLQNKKSLPEILTTKQENQPEKKTTKRSCTSNSSNSSGSDLIIVKKRRSAPQIRSQISTDDNSNNRYNTRSKSKKSSPTSKCKSSSNNSLSNLSMISEEVFPPKTIQKKKILSSNTSTRTSSLKQSPEIKKLDLSQNFLENEDTITFSNLQNDCDKNKKQDDTISNASTLIFNNNAQNKINNTEISKSNKTRINLSGDCQIGTKIILEAELSEEGWSVGCISLSKGNFFEIAKSKTKDLYNVDISINKEKISSLNSICEQSTNTSKLQTQSSMDSFYKNQKKKNPENLKQDIVSSGNTDQNRFKEKIQETIRSVKDTTITDTLFSSCESVTNEKTVRKIKIKTAEEINAAIETIYTISDEDEPLQNLIKKSKNTKLEKRKRKICPKFKIIEEAPFAVDAFNYGPIPGVDFYFLTHFHSDHYVGLTKKFCKPLYCSRITANLLDLKIKVDKKYINILDLNKSVIINDIEVTALDANHCPGSIMLLFKFKSGQYILHTGDFRATPEMESYPQLQNINIDKLYLDTTYCKKQYSFPSQEESIKLATEISEKWLSENDQKSSLIVIGTYLIGKERMWLGLCKNLSKKVWIDKSRLQLLKAFEDDNYTKFVEDDPKKAEIHVVPLQDLTQDKLSKYLKNYKSDFKRILAIRPSGWEHRKKPYKKGDVTIAGVPYSEHSSYSELKNFVSFLKPRKLIATAGNENQLSKFYNDCGLRDPSVNTIDNYFIPSQE